MSNITIQLSVGCPTGCVMLDVLFQHMINITRKLSVGFPTGRANECAFLHDNIILVGCPTGSESLVVSHTYD